jgi:hypothetical protein
MGCRIAQTRGVKLAHLDRLLMKQERSPATMFEMSSEPLKD